MSYPDPSRRSALSECSCFNFCNIFLSPLICPRNYRVHTWRVVMEKFLSLWVIFGSSKRSKWKDPQYSWHIVSPFYRLKSEPFLWCRLQWIFGKLDRTGPWRSLTPTLLGRELDYHTYVDLYAVDSETSHCGPDTFVNGRTGERTCYMRAEDDATR